MPRYRDKLIDIACFIKRETERAYCVTDDMKREVWLPKSQCEWDPDGRVMTMPEWLAYEKELL